MGERDQVQVELIKLITGERLLRLIDLQSGLALEKKLDPALAVAGQKERLFRIFDAALARAALTAA
jgi:hypothetical protein